MRFPTWLPVVFVAFLGPVAKSDAPTTVRTTAPATAPAIKLERVLKGLEHPLHLTHDGTPRIFICEQPGRVRLLESGQLQKEPYLDLTRHCVSDGECGLLSVAFHPQFAQNGLLYVYYTDRRPQLKCIISEFHTDPKATSVDPATERRLLDYDKPFPNHNGGGMAFGPDGYLYLATGDGGLHDDPHGNAQNAQSLMGKFLRIDVNTRGPRGEPYGVPRDNPFVKNGNYFAEIWALGIRNAWRWSFDRETGELYAGDVGQNLWEEIDLIVKGGNYGWRPREGLHANPNIPAEKPLTPAIDPIKEYVHKDGDLSITGGYVYRGKEIPFLRGVYVYGDFASGRIWGLRQEKGKVISEAELLHERIQPASFGEDAGGEIYVCDYGGSVWKLVAR